MKWCHGSDECENVHLALKQKCKYVFKGFLIKKVSEVSSAEAIDCLETILTENLFLKQNNVVLTENIDLMKIYNPAHQSYVGMIKNKTLLYLVLITLK